MGSPEGGPARVGCKGKNFIRAEEEQLCKSVMLVSQDRVVGNQQKAGVFWERIAEHYNENRPDGVRPLRSLETKWGLIKHNVSKFCGIYNQIERLHKSGSNAADTMRDAKELYRQKSAKNTDFLFEHCWLLLKDCPRWADGWTQPSVGRKRVSNECEGSNTHDVDVGYSEGATRSRSIYNERPGGVKSAKQDSMQQKVRDGALYAQAEATKSMAAVQMRKVALIEDQNMLLLMTMPIEESAGEDAREYMRLRRGEELKKLKKRLSAAVCAENRDADASHGHPGASNEQAGGSPGVGGPPPNAARPSPAAAPAAGRAVEPEEALWAPEAGLGAREEACLWQGERRVQEGRDEGMVGGGGESEGAGGESAGAGGRRRGPLGGRRAGAASCGGAGRWSRPAGGGSENGGRQLGSGSGGATTEERHLRREGASPDELQLRRDRQTTEEQHRRREGALRSAQTGWRAAGSGAGGDPGEWDPEVEGREWEQGEEMVEEGGDGVVGGEDERRGLHHDPRSAVDAPKRRGATQVGHSAETGWLPKKTKFRMIFGFFSPAPACVCWQAAWVSSEVEFPAAAPQLQ